ncbi:MAG: hypothetical protein JXB29_08160, partial [Sedimentisphaerales bacterium]|nr:hypothetical protein [Sedimentisphaerales bacterium]
SDPSIACEGVQRKKYLVSKMREIKIVQIKKLADRLRFIGLPRPAPYGTGLTMTFLIDPSTRLRLAQGESGVVAARGDGE